VPEFDPARSAEQLCYFIANKLRNLKYSVHPPYKWGSSCKVEFYHPWFELKVEEILREAGVKEPFGRALWSTAGNITVTYSKELDIFRVEGELPMPLIPDGFRRCTFPAFHKWYTVLKITEVHPHAYRGHGAVHVHFEGEILDPTKKEVDRLFEEMEKFLENMEGCHLNLMPGED